MKVNNKFKKAIADAREWIVNNPPEAPQMAEDGRITLNVFDQAIKYDDLELAVGWCKQFAREWASSSTSGFQDLLELAFLIDCDFETDDDVGTILTFDRDTNGDWVVSVGWCSGVNTVEPVERLADWGLV
jgi:hypothetical protein